MPSSNPWGFDLLNLEKPNGVLADAPAQQMTTLLPKKPAIPDPRVNLTKIDRQNIRTSNQDVQKDLEEQTDQKKVGQTRSRLFDPDEVSPILDMIRGLPEIADQKKGIGDLEDAISMMREMPSQRADAWVKPLLALADSQTGSNLLKGYVEPTAAKNRSELLLKYGDEAAKRKGDLAKTILDSIGKFKSGTDIEQMIQGSKALQEAVETQKLDQFSGEGYVRPSGGGKGLKTIPAKMAAELGEASKTPARIEELITAISNNKDKMGKLASAANWGAKLVGMDSPSAELENQLASIKQDIGKLKEGGVLREADERKYNKMMPKIGDDPDRAIKNLRLMQREISQKWRAHIAGLTAAKYDVEQFHQFDNDLITPSGVDQTMKPKYKAGAVKGGYRFKGGDWKDKANWVKVK